MYKLYLDDVRNPTDTYLNTKNSDWCIVRDYDDFVQIIELQKLPSFVSFDHDIFPEHYRPSMYAEDKHYSKYYTDGTFKEKTGFEAAKWLTEYCLERDLDLPEWNCHSMNPIGKENIISILSSYTKVRKMNKS
jgi:hypothetical protein